MFRHRASSLALATLTWSALLLGVAGPVSIHAQQPEATAAPAEAATPPAIDPVTGEPAIANSKCLGCHDDAEMKDEAGRSVAVHEAAFTASAHKRVACVECHTAALSVKHKGKRQPLGPVAFDV